MSISTKDIPEIFFEDGWLTAVDYLVSSGKEGTVYCCLAEPHTGQERFAVKIHRGRTQRSFKNDAIYLSGRPMGVALNGSRGIKSSGMGDKRLQRAVAKRTRRGIAAIEHSWINHEYNTLQVLHEAGASVPQPFTMSGHALLMEFIGDDEGPAPKLKHVEFSRGEAQTTFTFLVDEIQRWLSVERIHGDLSPFNILYWEDKPVIIDLPQAINPRENPQSLFLLERDIRHVLEFFVSFGVMGDAERIAKDLWQQFLRGAYPDLIL